jgi:preprotein translocase subunit SecD
MDRSLKWRTIALLLVVLLCVALLAPTWPGSRSLPSWFPFQKKISLGLDLQGGMHIVYSIDLDRAVDDKASDIKRDLEARFAEENVAATVKIPGRPIGSVTVVPADPAKRAEILSKVQADHGSLTEERECGPDDGAGAICIRVSSRYADDLKKSALTNAVNTIRERINEKGVAEPSVVEKGDDIIVELPGNPEDEVMQQTRDIISRTAKLEFKVVDDTTDCRDDNRSTSQCYMLRLYAHVGSTGSEEEATEPRAKALGIKARITQWTPEETGQRRTDHYLEAYDREESVPVAWAKKHGCLGNDAVIEDGKVRCKVSGRQIIERYLFGDPLLGEKGLGETNPDLKVPDDHQIGFEQVEPPATLRERPRSYWMTYYLDRAVRLTGSAIANAMGSNDPNTGRPIVLIDFNRAGSRVFGDLTAKIVGKKLATILDDKIKSAPYINGPIRGSASITMGGGDVFHQERERAELVNVLKTGSLPAPLREESAQKIGPTLGRDAIDKTQLSFIIGVILVVLIMVLIYRWSGWIAVFTVALQVLMTLAVMAAFGATLTLPGVAAVVLSVGMTVDGNILIYERIRDELLLGKSVRGAVDLGFARAFSAILDGQLTTAAAGWVLLQYGSGPIKGFAVMLLVGVFTMLISNIWVSRIFFDWYVSRKKGQLATISI